MGLRERIGGKIEDIINARIDEFKSEDLKKELHAKVDELVNNNLDLLKTKLKANIIDMIDGEDDIPNV